MTEQQTYPQWRVEDVDGHTCALKISSPVPGEDDPGEGWEWEPVHIVSTLKAQVTCPPWTDEAAILYLVDWDFNDDDHRLYVILVFEDDNPNPCGICARDEEEERAAAERAGLERGTQATMF